MPQWQACYTGEISDQLNQDTNGPCSAFTTNQLRTSEISNRDRDLAVEPQRTAPNWPTRQSRFLLSQREHIKLLEQLPTNLRKEYRSTIKRFLCHLEASGLVWSKLVTAAEDKRPRALENAVNEGIYRHRLSDHTRAAINRAFGLQLLGMTVQKPTAPEHKKLMERLPLDIPQPYRSSINRFLCHLEEHGQTWSQLVSDEEERRPAPLNEAVNKGIRDYGLSSSTRAAFNSAFGFSLLGTTNRKPLLQEHIRLLAALPPKFFPTYRSAVNGFLCHLEALGHEGPPG